MKVALPWAKEIESLTDEFNITFANTPGNFDWLLDFLEQHKDNRFNITIDTSEYEFDLDKLKFAKLVNPNIHIVLNYQDDFTILQDLGINYYFNSHAAAESFRQLELFVTLGATDVYIVDDLCYQLNKVRDFCDEHNVQVRMILDEIPSRRPDAENDPRAPYFIPEMIEELAQYIDVFEFVENTSLLRLKTLYKVWFENEEWRENLRFLYPKLELEIHNQSLIPDFIKYKMNCGYKCSYGSVCKRCNQFLEMAQILFDKNIEYNWPREKEGNEDDV